MTTPQLNLLLDEAVQRCQVLTTAAGEAGAAGTQVTVEALELAKLAEEEGHDLHEQLQKAIAAVQDAAHRVTAAADSAIASLDGVPGRAAETGWGVAKLLDALREQSLRVDGARVGLFDGLRTAIDSLNEDYQDLAKGLNDYLQRVTKAFVEAGQPLHYLGDNIRDVGLMLGHRFEHTRKEVEQLGHLAEDQSVAFVRSMDHGSQKVANHVTEMLNETINAHNALAEELHSGIADPIWIEDAMKPLVTELENLSPVADHVEEGLSPAISQIATSAESAADHLATTGDTLSKVANR